MDSKIKILLGILVLGILVVEGWLAWNSQKQVAIEEKITCNQKCISLGYISGICRTFPVLPNTTTCEEDEINIGHTSDCKPPVKDGEPIGGGGWACCCKLKEKLKIIVEGELEKENYVSAVVWSIKTEKENYILVGDKAVELIKLGEGVKVRVEGYVINTSVIIPEAGEFHRITRKAIKVINFEPITVGIHSPQIKQNIQKERQ